MMKNTTFTQLLAALALLVQLGAARAQELVVFGDSLSDIGNLASVQGPFPPPFYLNSRVSNGPVAVEVAAGLLGTELAPSLHLLGLAGGTNYAVAGAQAGRNEPIDLANQIGAFLLANGGTAPAENIYIVLIGGNDVRAARDTSGIESIRIIRNAINAIELQLNTLIAAGATAIMVVGAPDIGLIPESLELVLEPDGKRIQKRASLLTRLFNRRLSRVIDSVESATGVDLVELDLTQFFENIVTDAAARQFSNTTEPCLDTRTFEFNEDCGFGVNFDQFVFFDQIHPSARAHEIAGRLIYAYLPVPES